jgi:hypothetical protein
MISSDETGDQTLILDVKTIGELSAISKDRVVATGEKLACRMVVASLISKVGQS